jgi:hypothetical protein
VGIYYLPVFCQQGKVSHIYSINVIEVGNATRDKTFCVQPLPAQNFYVFEINPVVLIQITCELRLGRSQTGQRRYQYE